MCIRMRRTAPCSIRCVIQCIGVEHMYADMGAGAYVYKNTAYVFWLCRQRGANINVFFSPCCAHCYALDAPNILTFVSFRLFFVCIQAKFFVSFNH